MMTDFIAYELKVAALIAVFYMFYRLMLARETFHRVNRLVLLTTAVASFLLPLCVVTLHRTVTVEPVAQVSIGSLVADVDTEPAALPWTSLLLVIYMTGAAATFGHTLLSVAKVLLLISRSQRHRQTDGTTICVTGNADVAPFSWLTYIVMNPGDYAEQNPAILAHERGHIRLRHSLDVLLVDLLTALQWFNPAMWMLRHDLRAIHEYEADGEVLSQGISARQYQYLLISKAAGIGGYSIANGIAHSTLKNRIKMMNNKEYKRSHLLKLLAIVPIVGTTMALNARTVIDYVHAEPQRQQPVKRGQKAAALAVGKQQMQVVTSKTTARKDTITVSSPVAASSDEKTYDVCDEMPQFPGGVSELMKFLSMNIRYPEGAEEKGDQGHVIVSFVVKKDGSISGAEVRKSVSPELDAEALRIINAMPAWTPGKQHGEPVSVKYTLPVTFRLQTDKFTTVGVGDVKLEDKTVKSISYMVKKNGEMAEEATLKDDFDVEVDGVKSDKPMSEVLKELNPDDIESMTVVKSGVPKPIVIIVTKKK